MKWIIGGQIPALDLDDETTKQLPETSETEPSTDAK
jgi:hypothetical protein